MPPSTLENQQGGTAFSQATFLTTDFIFNSGCLPHANCPSACIFYVLIWLPHPQLSPSFCFFWMLAAPNGCAGCRIWWGNFWQFRHCFPSLGSILIGQGFVQNGFSARERSQWAQAPRFLPLFRNSPAVTWSPYPVPLKCKAMVPSLGWPLPQVFHKPADCQRGVFGCSRVTSPSPCGPYPESVPIPLLCHCECLEFYQLPEVLVLVTGHGFEDSLVGIMTSRSCLLVGMKGIFKINWKLSCEQH